MAFKIATSILEITTATDGLTAGLNAGVARVRAFGAQVDTTSKSIARIGQTMQTAFGLLAIGAVGKQFLDFAGEVTDLSERLQTSTTTVQEWRATFGKAGIELGTVAKSSEILSQKLTGGDKSAVGALKAMGLSVDALLKMKPEDRFIKVADAVGRLQNQDDRIAASKGLFGKGGPELLAALDGHIEETTKGLHDMGVIIDEETIAAADDFGDQLGLMGTQFLGIVATVVGPLLPALSGLGTVLSWLGREVIGPVLNVAVKSLLWLLYEVWEQVAPLIARLAQLGSSLPGVGKYLKQYADMVTEFGAKAKDLQANLWKQRDATEATGTAAQQAAPIIAGLGDASDAAAKQHKKQADELEKLVAKINQAAASDFGFGLFNGGYDPTKGNLPGLSLLQAFNDAIDQMQAKGPSGGIGRVLGLDAETIEQAIALGGASGLEAVGQTLEATVYDRSQSGFADAIGQLPTLMRQAFTGGGGFKGAAQAFASLIGEGLGAKLFAAGGPLNGLGNKMAGIFGDAFGLALPGIGQALGALIGPLIGKMLSGLRRLFGGPSQEELQGRDVEAQFEREFSSFDDMVNRIGDAYAALGRDRSQAAADVKAMLDAERQGPAAVQAWVDTFRQALADAEALRERDAAAAEQLESQIAAAGRARMTAMEREIDGMLSQRSELARALAAEADEEVRGNIELAQEAELHALDAQLQTKADEYALLAAETGQTMADAIVQALRAIEIEPILVPARLDMSPYGVPADLNIQPMADGGIGEVTRPTLFLAGERGRERFAFLPDGKSFGFGDGLSALQASVDALRRDMATQVGHAVVHAMAKYGVA